MSFIFGTQENLLKKIKQKREQMLEIAEIYGIGNEKTLKYSQELDILIVKYQRLKNDHAKF
ncbi:aspartyl-phosphate phosphatase Spo0E family protein [Lentibacillus salicampi]|uniref:Aspartyl-phosphate phosphatase Spo0E family protein n=1 Tax=Lentibacillus salicampi TaxID=175306 RepID=A0A4Y9A9F3_9BACI|nr:aspartyl-phosphate phosphatase Spo0E family protein [Lentibacillus salicampi]TFJ91520.1 aspartyl-phosphate phosphatase Spo0E family protein [Lentibacillus salicampi]